MKPRLLSTARLSFPLASAIAALLAAPLANASTLYWDGGTVSIGTNGNGLSGGTSGNWDTALTNWDQGSGLAHVAWNNANNDTAFFGGTAGTVTLTAPITVGGLTFNTTNYVITATSPNTLSFGAANNAILFNDIAAATITGTVAGSGNVSLSASNPNLAGTLTLNGTSTGGWSGTTTIGPKMTLSLAGSNQALANTSGITLNGGGITLTNINNTEGALDRVAAVGITSNGGTITYANTAASAAVYTETLGSVDLAKGQLNLVLSADQLSGGGNAQTLTLGGLSQSGTTSAVSFSALTTGPNITTNIIRVNGITTNTAAGKIIGSWATVGTAAAAQTDYAVYNSDGTYGRVVALNATSATSDSGWSTTWADTSNYAWGNGTTGMSITATKNINTLRHTGGAETLTLASANLGTLGILNGSASTLTIAATGTGAVTLPTTTADNLHVNAGSGAITISAPINNNTGALTLVNDGAGTLTLSSTTSNYSGGTVLNAGTLAVAADSNLGATTGGVTFNGAATLSAAAVTFNASRAFTINAGAVATIAGTGTITIPGVLAGSGALIKSDGKNLILSNTANTFSGPITSSNTGGSYTNGIYLTSIGDGAGAGLITLGASTSGTVIWQGSSGSTTTLLNRQFAISGAVNGIISASGITANDNLVINKDLLVTGATGGRALLLVGANTGNNTFAGNITDGPSSVLSLTKEQAGTWILSGTNTYTGTTTIAGGGTLIASSTNNLGDGSATNALVFGSSGGTLKAGGTITSPSTRGVTMTGAGTINTNGNAVSIAGVITGAGALTKSGTGNLTLSGTNTFTGTTTVSAGTLSLTNALALQNSILATTGAANSVVLSGVTTPTIGGLSGAVDLSSFISGYSGVTALTLNSSTATYTGVISNGSGAMSLTKAGANIQTLQGTNTYTGATTVSAGTLTLSGANGSILTSSSPITLNGGKLFLDSSTNNNTNRIAGNVNLSLGGELSLSGNTAGTSESISQLGINYGYSTVTVKATTLSSTLAASSFLRSNNKSTALFRGTSLGQSSTSLGRITLTDASALSYIGTSTLNDAASTDTTKDVKIVPYLIGGTTDTDTGSTFVTYDTTLGFRALNTANQFNTTVTSGTNVRLAAAQTGITSTSINSLIIANTGSSTIADANTLTVGSGAILFSSGGTIAPAGTTGVLDFGANTGYISAANTISPTISAPITGSAGLVITGSTGVDYYSVIGSINLSGNISVSGGLTINTGYVYFLATAPAQSYTGGVTLNNGSLLKLKGGGVRDLLNNNAITANGNAKFQTEGNITSTGGITLNTGSVLSLMAYGCNYTTSGAVTGAGGLVLWGSSSTYNFNSTGNTFTGGVDYSGNNSPATLTVNSFADSASLASGKIRFGQGPVPAGAHTFTYGSGAIVPLTLTNRQFDIAGSDNGTLPTINNESSQAFTINSDLLASGTGTRTLTLGGTGSGLSTFAGAITNGSLTTLGITKAGIGTWVLSGANTYTGATSISDGTLSLTGSLTGGTAISTSSTGILNESAAGVISGASTITQGSSRTSILSGANTYTGATTLTLGTLSVGASNNLGAAASNLVFNGGTLQITGTTLTNFSGIGHAVSFTAATTVGLDINNIANTFTADQVLNQTTGGLTKAGAGTLLLNQNNTYTGATTVNAGTLPWSKANDNSCADANKFGCNSSTYSLTYDFITPIAFDSYNWSTANDSAQAPNRSPKSWKVEGSNNNYSWKTLDTQTDYYNLNLNNTWAAADGLPIHFNTFTTATSSGAQHAFRLLAHDSHSRLTNTNAPDKSSDKDADHHSLK